MEKVAEELKVTYDDLLSLGETNQRIELFDGEIVMSAMPATRHQRIGSLLYVQLFNYVRSRNLGFVYSAPVDVVLANSVVFQPDLCFISNERMHIDDGEKIHASPDLVIEILSDSTEKRDRTLKFREYARNGATEYWLIAPDKREVEVFSNSDKGFQLVKIFSGMEKMSTPLFPDADVDLKVVFAS